MWPQAKYKLWDMRSLCPHPAGATNGCTGCNECKGAKSCLRSGCIAHTYSQNTLIIYEQHTDIYTKHITTYISTYIYIYIYIHIYIYIERESKISKIYKYVPRYTKYQAAGGRRGYIGYTRAFQKFRTVVGHFAHPRDSTKPIASGGIINWDFIKYIVIIM